MMLLLLFSVTLFIKAFILLEIPLFHVLNARITFGNVNGCSTAEETASQSVEGTKASSGKRKLGFVINKKNSSI